MILAKRIADAEVADIVIIPASAIDDLITCGLSP